MYFFCEEFNDHDLGSGESFLRKKFNEIIKDLEENKLTHQGSIKLISSKGGIKYLRAKLSDSDRLLFTSIEHNGKNIFVILEVILNHDYHKSKFLTNTNKEKIKNIKIISKEVSDTAGEVEIGDAPQVRWLGKFITFSAKQEEIVEDAEGKYNLPLVVSGSAGSGKTSVALEKLRKIEEGFKGGKILYITKSENLIKKSKELYEYEYYNETTNKYETRVPEQIEFLSIHEFLEKVIKEDEKIKKRVEGKKPINRNAFFSWFNGKCKESKFRKYAKDGDKIFEEFAAVIGGGGLGKAEYEELGDRQAIFPKDKRGDIYGLFEKYKEFIEKSSEYYDTSLVAHECVKEVQKVYDVVVVDEVQDLTESTLGLILKSLKDESKGNFLLCGDVNQVIHPSFFSLSRLKSFLSDKYEKNQKLKLCNLEKNYRNSEQVIEFANRILHLKNYCFASEDKITVDNAFFMKSDNNNQGNVGFITDDKKEEIGEKIHKSVNWAVLVLDDGSKQEAREIFKASLVFNIHEAKGLEFENVILYKFTSCKAYNEIWNIVCSGKSEWEIDINSIRDSYNEREVNTSRNKDKKDKSLEKYKFYMNALYVGVTRAAVNLYIMDDKSNLLKIIEPREEGNVNIEQEKSSLEEWRDMALKLIEKGNIEQARNIAIEKLPNKKEYAKEIVDVLEARGYNKEAEDINNQLKFPLDKNEQAISELKTESITPQKSPLGKSRVLIKNYDRKKGKRRTTRLDINKAQQDRNDGQKKKLKTLEEDEGLKDIICNDKIKKFKKRDISQYDKESIFSLALEEVSFKIAEHLVVQEEVNVNATDKDGFTLLHLAAQEGKKDTVELLLKNGADVNATTSNGGTPLHLAAQQSKKDVAELLLDNGAGINAKANLDYTPLHVAAQNGHDDIVQLLLDNGADIYAETHEGCTSLYFAAEGGRTSVVQLLRDNGADISKCNKKGATPLHAAAESGHVGVAKLLLRYKADVKIKNNNGCTALHVAADYNNYDIVQLFLDDRAEVDVKSSNGCSPLHLAAESGQVGVAEFLLNHGANVNARSIIGFTPLHLAAQEGKKDIVELLLDKGAEVNAKVGESNCTPLHSAVQDGHFDVAQLLLNHGANVNAKINNGKTSLTLALEQGCSEVVGHLLADPNINVGCIKIGCVSCKNKKDKEKFLQKLDQDNKLFKKVEEAANEKDVSKLDELLKEVEKLLKPENEYGFKLGLNYSPDDKDENTTIKIASGRVLQLLYDYAEENIGVDTEIFKRLKYAKENSPPKSDFCDVSTPHNFAQAQVSIT